MEALAYEVIKEGQEDVLRIQYEGASFPPSVESSALCMMDTLDKLIQVPSAQRIVFLQKRTFQYDSNQTTMLREIANVYSHLTKQKKLMMLSIVAPELEGKANALQQVIMYLLKNDPIGAYVELKRLMREQKVLLSKIPIEQEARAEKLYLSMLHYALDLLERTQLIEKLKDQLPGYHLGDRSLYRQIFRPSITPDFLYTRLQAEVPMDSEEIDSYTLENGTSIMILKVPGDIKYLYHVTPPEFTLTEDLYDLLDLAKNVLAEHQPKAEEFLDTSRMRQTFFNIGKDLLMELAEHKQLELSYQEIEKLAAILVRYTVGFGLIEILLQDDRIQDITLNGPIGETPFFLVHAQYDECVTNLIPAKEEGESWATKFRLISGRPLDEANPVLDTELILPGARARVAVITTPLNPLGLAYAFRRHRDTPWTLALFLHNKMISPLGAGLLSFLVDGSRTFLIAGTRSSGKTSFLAGCMTEIMRKFRIITVEDTLEIPVQAFRTLGYNIQPMKVRAALGMASAEMGADEGIRTSLRLGDSSLIIGEVRSLEAKSLYEAMRIGALANVVAGTIHGDSPYGVFDRVVNDLGVPKTSFKATDIIVIVNPIRSADGLHKLRRVISITEVRKEWENDPLRERGFVELMRYNTKTDQLEPTDDLINGDSEILKSIAGNVKEWAGSWDAVWDNILLRAKIKETLVEKAHVLDNLALLEASFVILANDMFHRISDEVREELGFMDTKRIFFMWSDWLNRELKKKLTYGTRSRS